VTTDSTSTRGRTGTGRGGVRSRTGETLTRRTSTGSTVLATGLDAGRRALAGVRLAARNAARGLAHTVTPAGWFLVVVLLVGLAAGWAFGLVEGWVAAVVAGALLLLSAPFLLSGARFDIRLELDRERVVVGTDLGATLRVTNRGQRLALPSIVDVPVGDGLVETAVPLLAPGAEHVERLAIGAHRRGVVTVGPMKVSRGDPVGILRHEVSWPQVQTIHVHPVTTPIPSTSAGFVKDLEGMPSSDIVDSDLAFHAIREYMPGDSRRHVHWKSTAKTGRLMVRQYEETRRARIAVLLDLLEDEYSSDDAFELAVSCAASLAVQGVRDGREVLFATSGERRPSGGRSGAIRTLPTVDPKTLLDATCSIEKGAHADRLEDLTTLTAQSFPELSIACIVTGSGVPVERLRRAVFAFPTTVRSLVIRVEPGAEPLVRSTRDGTILDVGVLGDLKHLMARGAVA